MSGVFSLQDADSVTVASLDACELTPEALNVMFDEVEGARDNDGGLKLVLDLSKLHFLGSVELGVLVAFHRQVKERGGRLILAGLAGHPLSVLAVSGLNRALEVHHDVPSALRAMSGPPQTSVPSDAL